MMKKKMLVFSLILSMTASCMTVTASGPDTMAEQQEQPEGYETEAAQEVKETEVLSETALSADAPEAETAMLESPVQTEFAVEEDGILTSPDRIYYGQSDEKQKGVLKLQDGKLKYYVDEKFQSKFSGRLSGEEGSDYELISFYVKDGIVDTSYQGIVTLYNTEGGGGGTHFYVVNGIISGNAFESDPDDPSASMCSKATGLSIKNTADGIAVGYDQNNYGDDRGFYIYRLCRETGEFVFLAKPDGSSTGFVDKNVENGCTYTYYIWTYSFYNMWNGNGYFCGFVDLSIICGDDASGKTNTFESFVLPDDPSENDLQWEISTEGVLTISGNGPMPDYNGSNKAPWLERMTEIKSVSIQEGITSVGEAAFLNCTNLERVELASSVMNVNKGAFCDCTSLSTVELGKSLRVIDDYAFEGTTALSTICLPASLGKISSLAFLNAGLERYEIEEGASFSTQDGVLFNGNGTVLLSYPCGRRDQNYSIPSGVTIIGSNAFRYAVVTSVNIPNSVKKIRNYALADSSIETLVIPDSVTEAGERTVWNCKALTELCLGSGVENLSGYFADGCTSLKNVIFKEGLKRIEAGAFRNTALSGVDLPSSITYIGKNAFPANCSLNFSEESNLTDIGGVYQRLYEAQIEAEYNYDMAFQVLELVNQKRSENGLGALKMDEELLDGAMLRAAETSIYFDHTRPSGQSFSSINDKARGENIAAGNNTAVSVMDSWMSSTGHKNNILGNNYVGIGIGCVRVSGVYYWVQLFSDSEANVAADSNQNSSEITSVLFDKDSEAGKGFSVSVINNTIKTGDKEKILVRFYNTFRYTSLYPKSISFSSSDPSVITVSPEGEATAISEGSAEVTACLAKAPEIGGTIAITVEKKSTGTGQNPPGNGGQTGTNTVKKGQTFTAGMYKYRVTGVKEAAFTGLSNKKATTVKLPRTVKYRGKSYSVTSIAAKAFLKTKVKSVSISSSVKSIGTSAFEGCSRLNKVTIGKNIKTIGKNAFKRCTALKSVTIGSGIKTIGTSVFEGCSRLSKVTIGKNVKTIGKNAFKKCTSLKSVTLPAKLSSVGSGAFYGCKKLGTITIKSAKMKVGKNALKGIKSTARIKVPAKKLSAYKKILKGKGQNKKVRIIKWK